MTIRLNEGQMRTTKPSDVEVALEYMADPDQNLEDLEDWVRHWAEKALERLRELDAIVDDYAGLMSRAMETINKERELLRDFQKGEKQLIQWLEAEGWIPQDFIDAQKEEQE